MHGLLLTIFLAGFGGDESQDGARSRTIDAGRAAANDEPTPLYREVRVELRDGSLRSRELVEGLLRAYGLDGSGLDLPDARLDVRGWRGVALVLAARRTLGELGDVAFVDGRRALSIRIDRRRERDACRERRAELVELLSRWMDVDLSVRTPVLAFTRTLRPGEPVVVLLHGTESRADAWDALVAYLGAGRRPLATATYDYPNDASLTTAAEQLAPLLADLRGHPIHVVGHSMGGLIARAVVEDPRLDPGNVVQLIQLGSPNLGTFLARIHFAQELEQFRRGEALVPAFFETLRDGLGEASGDLAPGSVFLHELNSRPRNPRVHYRQVLGTGGPLTAAEWQALRPTVFRLVDALPASQLYARRCREILEDMDEVVEGAGDGVVSLRRARLDGVEAVLVPRGHSGLVRCCGPLSPLVEPAEHPVFVLLDSWLREVDPPARSRRRSFAP